jgi:hypothetical protein
VRIDDNFFAILLVPQRAMKTHGLMMPEPKREQIQKIAEAQVIVLFITHFKEKFFIKNFLIVSAILTHLQAGAS